MPTTTFEGIETNLDMTENLGQLKNMGPAMGSSSASSSGITSESNFLSNVKSKKRYRDTLRRWVRTVYNISIVDPKFKGMLCAVGQLIFMACDETTQDLLQKAGNSGLLCLDGSEDVPKRSKLTEQTLKVIAKESETDHIKKEVELLSEIPTVQRNTGETPSKYVVRFNRVIAKYANHSGVIGYKDNRQFAILMLKNANLSPDTINSVMFQLTILYKSAVRSGSARISCSRSDIEKLSKYAEARIERSGSVTVEFENEI